MHDEKLISAATILMVRDAPEFQVLMVERHHQIDFAAGALVFPGGKAAADDADPAWVEHVMGADAMTAQQRALRICAVREAFEESGLLLARCARSGAMVLDGRGAVWAKREAVARGEARFLDLLRADGLVLALDALVPFAHWITPQGMPKRFDTHFFLAAAPDDQIASQDGAEAVDAVWISPNDALDQCRTGARKIIFPTRLNVALLAQSTDAAGALEAARGRTVKTVTPWIVQGEDGPELRIPDDAGYGVVREALGPNMP